MDRSRWCCQIQMRGGVARPRLPLWVRIVGRVSLGEGTWGLLKHTLRRRALGVGSIVVVGYRPSVVGSERGYPVRDDVLKVSVQLNLRGCIPATNLERMIAPF